MRTTSSADTTASQVPDAFAAWAVEARPDAGPLDELEFDRLSAAGRIDAVVAWERLVRHAQAGLIRCLGALAREAGAGAGAQARDSPGSRGLVESELSAALAWSASGAQARLAEADALMRLFPDTVRALSEGRVAVEQARCLAQLTAGLDDRSARAVEARVLTRMPCQSVAVTRQAVRRAVVRTDPDAAAQRHRYERARRHVELRPEEDGMATLSFYLPAETARMAHSTLTAMAQRAKRHNPADRRTLDQRRTDLLPALLHSATQSGSAHASPANGAAAELAPVSARVSVVVGIETLLGLSHEPGHLDGYGPICPEQTRRIAQAHGARWRFLLTASDGTAVDASTRTYTPVAAIKHLTELSRTVCAFPHCQMPTDRCDLDHNQPYGRGGPTCADNLAPLCRRHHGHKTFGHWELKRDGQIITWASKRTGRRYLTGPTLYQPTPVNH